MNAVNKAFCLAGHAIFTVEPSAEAVAAGFAERYTYLIERVEFPAKGSFPASVRYFVKVLTGPENTSDYTYLGMLNAEVGAVTLTAKSAFPASAKRVKIAQRMLARIWADDLAAVEAAGWKVHHAGRCGRCGRTLTVPESIETGFGPECVKAVTGFTFKQLLQTA